MKKPDTARRIVLRGYVKEAEPGRFVAVCLTLNLVVEGRTAREALHKVSQLVSAYLADAVENREWNAFVPRRAPLKFYFEYLCCRIAGSLISLRRQFKPFKLSVRAFVDGTVARADILTRPGSFGRAAYACEAQSCRGQK